jgi:hypothetical protein
MKKLICSLLAAVALGAAAAPAQAAPHFNLCEKWNGWRYGGDGFDYKTNFWYYDGGHIVHAYFKRSVLNGSVSRWRIYCS